jgi:hypothetical protein
MERMKTARNVAIIVLIAAAVEFLPGGGRAANGFSAALWIVFAAGLGWFGYRMYREHRISLHSLGDLHRGLLYGAAAVGYATAVAQPRMWQTGIGELIWFALIGLAVYTLVAVYRFSRAY